MGNVDFSIARKYNLHSIANQVFKLELECCSFNNNIEDVKSRTEQIWNKQPKFYLPCNNNFSANKLLLDEYGADVCNIALITTKQTVSVESLEIAWKLVAKIYHNLVNKKNNVYSRALWLEAAFQIKDHVLEHSNLYTALSLFKRTIKKGMPDLSSQKDDVRLFLLTAYPFFPSLSLYLLHKNKLVSGGGLLSLADKFDELIAVKLKLNESGWYWQVFDRAAYSNAPERELMKIKWIKKACKNKNISINNTDGGTIICWPTQI